VQSSFPSNTSAKRGRDNAFTYSIWDSSSKTDSGREDYMAKNFRDLSEREVLALAVFLEEEDGRRRNPAIAPA